MAIMVGLSSDFYAKHSPVHIISKIMKLCDYDAAQNSKFIAHSLIFIIHRCIVFIQ